MGLAKIVLSGTLVSEPEKRYTPNNNVAVTNFVMAVSDRGNTFNVKVTCWRALADAVADSLHSGDTVLVEGRLQTALTQSPEGVQKKSFEVEANSVDRLAGEPQPLLVGAGAATSTGGGASDFSSAPQRPASSAQPAPDFSQNFPAASSGPPEEFLTEDDIPF